MTLHLGIDPGLSGGLACLDSSGRVVFAERMPATERDLLDLLNLGPDAEPRAVLERVRSSPQMGVTSAFTFGQGYGGLRMALTACRIPFEEVLPRKWQTALGCLTGGDKNISKQRAQDLFPSVKCTHAISDALLLAEYLRRFRQQAMKTLITLCALLVASSASAQDCTPTALKPGPSFVPTLDCRGWVPSSHPLARVATLDTSLAQDVFVRIDTRGHGGPVNALSGFALDCALGAIPPVVKLIETKPDGSLREIPNDYYPAFGTPRPDVQAAYAPQCPAVLNVPLSDGSFGGANDAFGWSLSLRSPITEPGVHTFTAVFSWPAVGRSGSSSIAITVR